MLSKRYVGDWQLGGIWDRVDDHLQITGDDTPALQAVLDADVWRKHLLAEQEVWRVIPLVERSSTDWIRKFLGS